MIINNYMSLFIIFTKEDCKYCILSKKLLDSYNYRYVEVNTYPIESIKEKYNHYTYPFIFEITNIFNDIKFIGGYTELNSYCF